MKICLWWRPGTADQDNAFRLVEERKNLDASGFWTLMLTNPKNRARGKELNS